MFNSLLFVSIAPVLIIAFYIYSRDRYEKEPVYMLLKALFIGVLCVIPVVFIENIFTNFYSGSAGIKEAALTAFIVAGFTEEAVKYLAFILLCFLLFLMVYTIFLLWGIRSYRLLLSFRFWLFTGSMDFRRCISYPKPQCLSQRILRKRKSQRSMKYNNISIFYPVLPEVWPFFPLQWKHIRILQPPCQG